MLGQMVTIREEGTERQVTAAEAFYLQMVKRGLEGNTAAARAAIAAIEQARERQVAEEPLLVIIKRFSDPGSVTDALEPLRMARKLDPYRDTARMALEPWLAEAALVRLGKKRLSLKEQQVVVKATRTPSKVRGPDWWEARQ